MKVWTTKEWLSRRVTNNHTLNQILYGLFIQELQKRPDSKAYRYVWALASSHPTSWRKPWSRIWSEEALVKGCQAALFPSEINLCFCCQIIVVFPTKDLPGFPTTKEGRCGIWCLWLSRDNDHDHAISQWGINKGLCWSVQFSWHKKDLPYNLSITSPG